MSKLKRHESPIFWPIQRKHNKYVASPLPGPHSKKSCFPLRLLLRDILHHAENTKEVRKIVHMGIVRVNNRIVKEINFPVGLMDILTMQNESYRVMTDNKGLVLNRLNTKESGFILSRIDNKRMIRQNRIQLNLHDGRNMIVDSNEYKTGDVLVIDIENKTIKDVLKFKKNHVALITGGASKGSVGKIVDLEVTKGLQPNKVIISVSGRQITIPKNYIFVIGKETPIIGLGEEA